MRSTTWWRSSRRPDLTTDDRLDSLADRLGYHFADRALLAMAMAHRSWCAETPNEASNERLEFLGDAVLGLVVTDHLFRNYELPEGELAKVRASVVNSAALAEVAAELDIGAAVLLGKGEAASGGREKPSILADAMEAVIGALYLDRGYDAAASLVMNLLGDRIEEAAAGPGGQDYKTRLQELAARRFEQLPAYDVRGEGPAGIAPAGRGARGPPQDERAVPARAGSRRAAGQALPRGDRPRRRTAAALRRPPHVRGAVRDHP